MWTVKGVRFAGLSLTDLQRFPSVAKQRAGYQLYLVQMGDEPSDWKPLPSVGRGAREIRLRSEDGQYRVVYIATFVDSIWVLHAFQKKTQRTRQADIAIARNRLNALHREQRRE